LITFNIREFNDIAVTCYFYCREVTIDAIRYGRENLGMRRLVPAVGDDWQRETGMHLFLNVPERDEKYKDAILVYWKEGRLRLGGVRRTPRNEGANGEGDQETCAQHSSSSEPPLAKRASESR
jgi:hypothetical protein